MRRKVCPLRHRGHVRRRDVNFGRRVLWCASELLERVDGIGHVPRGASDRELDGVGDEVEPLASTGSRIFLFTAKSSDQSSRARTLCSRPPS